MESSVDIYTVNDNVNSGDNDDSNYLKNIFSNISNRSAGTSTRSPVTVIIVHLQIPRKHKLPLNFFYVLLAKMVYDTQHLSCR